MTKSSRTKIITWNVNGIRASGPKGLFDYMAKEDPDIFCLQETKAHPQQLPTEYIQPHQRTSYWSSAQRKGYSGVVTYLKTPSIQTNYGIGIRKFDSEGRFVVTDHQDFILYNVYFPNGGSGLERHEFKQDFLNRFKNHLNAQIKKGREVIVVGDYNVAYLDFDVYDSKLLSSISGFLPEERTWFGEFLKENFVDCFRHLHPLEEKKYSWWSYKERQRIYNRGWRIDHICTTRNLSSKLVRCEIQDQIMGSDHCPVVAEFEL
ncbi:MAG: exodeoxyribonuclease III [Bdellovibrionales bacterium]|nr:exodeoxyribonuclease III [Bdellovibrionales bacterium]